MQINIAQTKDNVEFTKV
jgi:hypothetical protein